MRHHLMFSQHSVKAGFGGQIDALISKFGNNLFGRQVAEFRLVSHCQKPFTFLFTQFVRRCCLRSFALVYASINTPPPDDCSYTETENLCCGSKTSPGFHGFIGKVQDYFPFLLAMSSSSSPQIAWAFFFNTSRAAASARAFSLRLSSFSSSLRRFASGLLPFAFFTGDAF